MKNCIIFIVCVFSLYSSAYSEKDVILPTPQKNGGKPLLECLQERSSTREFSEKELSLQEISNLLWAAWGYNRDKHRTAPSAHNYQEIELYLITKDYIYKYIAEDNYLKIVATGDLRYASGKQEFAQNAPLNIAFVSDKSKFKVGTDEQNMKITSAYSTGYISQNIYLYAASAGLGTIIRGFFDNEELTKVLKLNEMQFITLVQTIGYKK